MTYMMVAPGGTRYFGVGDDLGYFTAESSSGIIIRQHTTPERGLVVVCIGLSEYWGSRSIDEKRQMLEEMYTLLPFDELTKLYGSRIHPRMVGIGYCRVSQTELVLGLKTLKPEKVADLKEVQRITSRRFLEAMGVPTLESMASDGDLVE